MPSTSPSISNLSSFSAALAPSQAQALALNPLVPAGKMSMLFNIATNEDKVVTISTAAFSGTFTGFPPGSSLTSATVNAGVAGQTGPVVIDLNLAPGRVIFAADGSGMLTTSVDVTADVVSQITANPAAFYFQVATADFPSGIIRGQFSVTAVTGAGQ
jgi:hypothetical protein